MMIEFTFPCLANGSTRSPAGCTASTHRTGAYGVARLYGTKLRSPFTLGRNTPEAERKEDAENREYP